MRETGFCGGIRQAQSRWSLVYLNTLHDWLESRKLKLSAEKSSATVFTTWSQEAKFDPHLTIHNLPIPVKSKVKVMGVTINSMLNFGENAGRTKEKSQKRTNILKKIAFSEWGCTKETLSDFVGASLSFWSERLELQCFHLGFYNQKYKLQPPAKATKHCSSHNYWLCKTVWHQWLTHWGWNIAC